jgi:hypothetical protein
MIQQQSHRVSQAWWIRLWEKYKDDRGQRDGRSMKVNELPKNQAIIS